MCGICGVYNFGNNLEIKTEELETREFIQGRSVKILYQEKEIGVLGEIHPQIINNLGLEFPISALELDLENIFSFLAD